jgi:phosphatidylglycerophosphatase A
LKGGIDYQTEAALKRANRINRARRYKVERYLEEQAMEREDEGEYTVREIIKAWLQLALVMVIGAFIAGFIWGTFFD